MRLIDADKLIDEIKNCLWDWDTVDGITATTVLKQTITDIENQPTALLKGHGERVKPRLSREWYICECGASITVEVDGEPLHKAKYCAECGKGIEWE